MADRKPYPPQSLDGYHALRPFITKNRIGLKREVSRFFHAQIEPAAKFLGRFVGLTKADDPDVKRRAEDAVSHLPISWEPLADAVEPYLLAVAVAGGDAATRALEVDLADDFGADMRVRAESWAADRAAEMVGMRRQGKFLIPNPNAKWRIDETTRNDLRSLVVNAIDEGDSTQALAKRIQNAGVFSDERADMIARTEIAKADTQGALIGWRLSGFVIGKSWLAGGPRVCPVCLDHEAKGPRPLDYEYSDGVDGPPDHPHCFCVLTAVLEGENVITD
jgi:Phage Mu protein F like protein